MKLHRTECGWGWCEIGLLDEILAFLGEIKCYHKNYLQKFDVRRTQANCVPWLKFFTFGDSLLVSQVGCAKSQSEFPCYFVEENRLFDALTNDCCCFSGIKCSIRSPIWIQKRSRNSKNKIENVEIPSFWICFSSFMEHCRRRNLSILKMSNRLRYVVARKKKKKSRVHCAYTVHEQRQKENRVERRRKKTWLDTQ